MNWKKFTYRTCFFLIPVVLGFIGIEYLVRNIPNSISISSEHLKKNGSEIETLVLGASQNKRAINPVFLESTSMTVAGTRQGHKTDYYLLKDLHKQLPNLKRVIIGCTSRHFESKPNPKNFWKYRSHLLYYDVNAFERTTYFKDKILFLGNADFYSDQLAYYYLNSQHPKFNKYGFQLTGQKDRFKKLNYNVQNIINSYNTNNYPSINEEFLSITTHWFFKVLDYCQENQLEITLTQTPTFHNYRENQGEDVIYRRDSVVSIALKNYNNISLFNEETSNEYRVEHYLNENHLNPAGAEIFTKKLDKFLKESTSYQN